MMTKHTCAARLEFMVMTKVSNAACNITRARDLAGYRGSCSTYDLRLSFTVNLSRAPSIPRLTLI